MMQDGFSTSGSWIDGHIELYEFIDLETFPSLDDFHGKAIVIPDSSPATIIEHLGRPSQISRDPTWFKYDVYKILVNGHVCQVFRQNIDLPSSKN